MINEETRTDLGLIRVHRDAISSIASITALDVPGVKSIRKGMKAKFIDFIGGRSSWDIRVDINKNEEVKIDIPIFVKYGFSIPEIASVVQENVRSALEKMTSLSVKDINVNVIGIERG
ncbi:MAG: Asp23/Gls24 family envelope stress response protein [Candidatus Omnitrophica bacterium]|nr:Asp23/Gls24 family envelope stress response protein [Candidatus Omnitrophota bacterium]